jgi:tryptophan-associated transmembrane protein
VDARSDASPGLRLTGFALTAVGALLAGVGAIQTWVTVGLQHVQTNTNTAVPGTDLPDGKAVLGAAVVMLVSVLAIRLLGGRRGRATAAVLVIVAAFVCVAVSGAFIALAQHRSDVLDIVADASVRDAVDYFVRVEIGPYLGLIGGALGFVGGVLSLAWATRPGLGDAEHEPVEG